MVRPAIVCSKNKAKTLFQAKDGLRQAEGIESHQMTINVVCRCHNKFIKHYESYDAESMGNGVQKATTDNGVCKGGREACLPSRHLEGVNQGHLGIEYCTRLSNTFDREASTTSKALRKCILKRAGSSSERGNSVPLAEGSHFSHLKGTRGLLLNNFPSAQKEWPNEVSDQLEVPQSVGGGPTFQNGGHCDPERSSEAGGLDGEDRSERCLLHHPNSPSSSAVSEVQSGRAMLSVHLSSIRPLLCSMDVHKGNETSDDSVDIMGNQDNSIHRRHACHGKDKRGGETTHGSVGVSARSSGLYCQSGEVSPDPSTRTGISWAFNGLSKSSTPTAKRKDKADPQGSGAALEERVSLSTTTISISREAQCSFSSNVSRPRILSSITEGPPDSPCSRSPGLRASHEALQGCQGRTGHGSNIT